MRNRGFTLIEILVSLAIGAILIASGFWISFDSYRSSLFEKEVDNFDNLLEKARSEAINNLNAKPHGVIVEDDGYVLFEGATYSLTDPTNEKVIRQQKVEVTGSRETIFQNLSGNVDAEKAFIFSDGKRERIINVGPNGVINH